MKFQNIKSLQKQLPFSSQLYGLFLKRKKRSVVQNEVKGLFGVVLHKHKPNISLSYYNGLYTGS